MASQLIPWAGLAQTHVWYCNYATEGGQIGFNAHLVAARESLEKALAIEPDLPEALSARSVIETNFDYNWKGAAETLRKALALAPGDPALLMRRSFRVSMAFPVSSGPARLLNASPTESLSVSTGMPAKYVWSDEKGRSL